MGFFKKIGGFVKKATKQISFKNLVKVAGNFDPTGMVSNLQAQHEAEKQERAQVRRDRKAQEEYNATLQREKIGVKDVINGALGGALDGAGNVIAGTQEAGQTGAKLVDSTLNAWLKKNWLKLVGGILGTVTVVFVFVKMLGSKKPTYRRR